MKTQSVRSLQRALTLLEELAKSRHGLTLSELARKLRLPKSTTHCLLLTLERCGYLHRGEQSDRFMFGLKLFGLANMAPLGINLREEARPHLRALMDLTRLTVHMAIMDRSEVVLVEKIEPLGPLRVATWVGKRMDAHCTGVGKAIIANFTEEELDRLLKEHGLPRHNENTIVSPKRLKNHLAEIRKLGYSVEDEEDEIGARCIGAPLVDSRGKVLGAISVCGTTEEITPTNLSFLSQRVMQTASAISQRLCFTQGEHTIDGQ